MRRALSESDLSESPGLTPLWGPADDERRQREEEEQSGAGAEVAEELAELCELK